MKIILLAVTSANGKLTRSTRDARSGQAVDDPDIYKWTSKEDQEHFFKLREQAELIVMGSGTYEAIRGKVKNEKGKVRIILTSNPEKYKDDQIPGQLEFKNETPRELYERCSIDYTSMLLVGGAKIYSSFLKEGLVDEIYLTIEPVLFGSGKNFIAEENFETNLELVSVDKLNDKGTLLLKYRRAL